MHDGHKQYFLWVVLFSDVHTTGSVATNIIGTFRHFEYSTMQKKQTKYLFWGRGPPMHIFGHCIILHYCKLCLFACKDTLYTIMFFCNFIHINSKSSQELHPRTPQADLSVDNMCTHSFRKQCSRHPNQPNFDVKQTQLCSKGVIKILKVWNVLRLEKRSCLAIIEMLWSILTVTLLPNMWVLK